MAAWRDSEKENDMLNVLRPDPPNIEWRWISVCSAHQEYDLVCNACNCGQWKSDAEVEFSNWLWNYSPEIWRKWANRK